MYKGQRYPILKDGHSQAGRTELIRYMNMKIGGSAMKEYTAKEMKSLKADTYTFKVTKHKLYFTAEFKEAF